MTIAAGKQDTNIMKNINAEILSKLYQLKDEKYKEFQGGLLPTVNKENMIGVRTPHLKKLAKELNNREDLAVFLNSLPHQYFEEDQLHAFLIGNKKEMKECLEEVDRFLPYVNNWATCDQLNPGIFRRHKSDLPLYCKRWMVAKEEYTVRFGIKMLMDHFLGEYYSKEYPILVAGIRRKEYYIRMMVSWYFATALAKQYQEILPFFTEKRLDKWVHNKSLQKAVESNRIDQDKKAYLKTLRIR